MSTASGFKGWAKGQLSALATWEKKLGSDATPDMEHDIAELHTVLSRIASMKVESTTPAAPVVQESAVVSQLRGLLRS